MSQDKTINRMGRLLIYNCIRNNLVILNGRSLMIPTMEKSLVTKILLSDKPCSVSVSFELHVYHYVTDDASLSETTRIKRWNGDCSQTFASNLNTETIDVVFPSMPEVDSVDKDSINTINNDIAVVMCEAAEKHVVLLNAQRR